MCSLHALHEAISHYVIPFAAFLEAPANFQAAAGEREVTFSWSPPSAATPIIGYIISCSPSPATLPKTFFQSGTHTVGGFSPDTTYSCSVVAYNSQIIGPPATVAITTENDCML